jgi:hypothetical protein
LEAETRLTYALGGQVITVKSCIRCIDVVFSGGGIVPAAFVINGETDDKE